MGRMERSRRFGQDGANQGGDTSKAGENDGEADGNHPIQQARGRV
jgi:hypothetical protein